jgi:LmbE family N-acetylglucosaminyl deacetylase
LARTHQPAIFLAPHNDDETLFGSFTLLREKPHVVVCLKSMVQELRGLGITAAQREAETDAALQALGLSEWTQWQIPDSEPDWDEIEARFRALRAERFFAPAFEEEGHAHHNAIAEIAQRVFPRRKLTSYLTYTEHERSWKGKLVPFEPEWVILKLRALSCYRSQIYEASTQAHFLYPQYEYYAERSGPGSRTRLDSAVPRAALRLFSRSRT